MIKSSIVKVINSFSKRVESHLYAISIVLLIGLFFFFLSKGSIMSADSLSYIQKEITRSPLYPLLIGFLQTLFGSQAYTVLVAIQLAFGFYTCFLMASFFQKRFKLNSFYFLFFLLITLTPYTFHFGNTVLSEGLAYPLFLLSCKFLFESVMDKDNKRFYWFLIMLSLLILTRRQYLFLYIVGIIAILYLSIYSKKFSKTQWVSLTLALVGSVFITDFLERSYHYYYNGKFTTVPFVGIQLMTMPIYLSTPKDANLYDDKEARTIITESSKLMSEKRCNASSVVSENESPEYWHYYVNYNNVSWGSLSKAVATAYPDHWDWVTIDKKLVSMYWPFLKVHWKRMSSLYIRNVIQSMGGYYLFIFIAFVFVSSLYFHHRNRDNLSLGLFFVVLITYGNYFSTALVEPAMTRYTFSTNILLVIMLMIAIAVALMSKNSQHLPK